MPPLAQIAIRQAPQVAANIIASIQGRPTAAGHVAVQGILVPLGRHRGVAKLKGIRIEGFFAWAMWRAIYLVKTPGWRRRFRVLMDWFINMFCKRDYVQLGMVPDARREFHASQHIERSRVDQRPSDDGAPD